MNTTLYTERHGDHASQWQMPALPDGQAAMCLACTMELLEDSELLLVKRKIALGRLLGAITAQPNVAVRLLQSDMRITAHLVVILINGLAVVDETFVSMASETVIQLVSILKSESIVCCIMDAVTQQSLKLCNFRRSAALFTLVGRLLHDIPALAVQLLTGYGSLVDYVAAGLAYPDPVVQAATAYICFYLYSSPGARRLVPHPLTARLAPAVLAALNAPGAGAGDMAKAGYQLQINGLGLLRVMVEDPEVSQIWFSTHDSLQAPDGRSALTLVLKRALLGRENLLQVAAVQCLDAIINHDTRGQHFADTLLLEDVAEFLFEALSTTNELLIGSIITCLLRFTKTETFFKKCHAVYGIEAIMRAIEQASKLQAAPVMYQGMTLLNVILDSQPSSIRLFSNVTLARQCLRLTAEGATTSDHRASLAATNAFSALLSPQHLPSPLPCSDISDAIRVFIKQGDPLMEANTSATRKGAASGRHPDLRSKRKHETQKAERAQQRILANVNALKKACLLVAHCAQNPAANADAFLHSAPVKSAVATEPNPAPGDKKVSHVNDLIQCLQATLAEHFIPTIVLHAADITDANVFLALFSSLHLFWDLNPEPMEALGRLFTEAGFIRFCLTTRVRFSTEVKNAVDDCLVRLYLLHAPEFDSDTKYQAVAYLKQGLVNISGGPTEMLSMLYQNSEDPDDQSLSVAQCSAISLVSAAYSGGDREVAPPSEVVAALSAYLRLHEHHVTGLPAFILRQLVLLYALSWWEVVRARRDSSGAWDGADPRPGYESTQPEDGGLVLGRLLAREGDPQAWCVRRPPLLHWVFSDPTLAAQLGPELISFWIASDSESSLKTVVDAAQQSSLCLEAILTVFSKLTDKPAGNLVYIVSEVLAKSKPTSTSMKLLRQRLPTVLQHHLLSSTAEFMKGELAQALLRLLTELKVNEYMHPLTETDTKLAFHVCRLLAKSADSSPSDLQEAALCFLACLLAQSFNQHDNRVASLVLSDAALLRYLEVQLTSSIPQTAAVNVMSLLVRLQPLYNLQVHHAIHSCELGLLPNRVPASSIVLRSALFYLWSAYLDTTKWADGKEGVLVIDTETGTSIPVISLRLLMIDILQSLTQGLDVLQTAATGCFSSLLLAVRASKKNDVESHLLNHPWMEFILQLFQNREGQSGTLTVPLFRFCIQLLCARGRRYNDILNKILVRHLMCADDTTISSMPHECHEAVWQIVSEEGAVPGVTRQDIKEKLGSLKQTPGSKSGTIMKPVRIGHAFIFTNTSQELYRLPHP